MLRPFFKLLRLTLAASVLQLAITAALGGPADDALTAYQKGEFATALKLLRPLAEQGDVRAQIALADMYFKGEGVPKNTEQAKYWSGLAKQQANALMAYNRGDYATALRIYEPLADKGQVLAEYIVGLMYANGQGVQQSYPKAIQWHRKAAEQGEARAQFSVGVMYFKGLGVQQNYAEAFKWYQRAAAQGNATALFNLGAMYANGKSVAPDPVRAYMLYSLAADRDIRAAAAAKQQLAKSMSASQIAEADKRAHEWKPTLERNP